MSTSNRPLLAGMIVNGDEIGFVVHACSACGVRSLQPTLVCGNCGSRAFQQEESRSAEGVVTSFTVVHMAPPGIAVPFVSVVVRLDDGLSVRGNLVDTDPVSPAEGSRVRIRAAAVPGQPDVVGYEFVPAGPR
ncbi:MAG TPA: OB-fold domain-containing protein [Pseudonocardia sp.]|jgi:uncharacterized OB-fold protein|nr:OB-fold domain-containing protein [Pseudonocardia sp.]